MYDTTDTKCRVPAKSGVESVEISIAAIGKKGKEGETTTKTFYRLDKIEESAITFDETGVMSWEAVEGADEYIVKINNEEVKVTETEFDQFEYGKTNSVQVKPSISDGSSFSAWSTKISKAYLGAPTNIKYDGVTVTWTGSNVSSCRGFAIYIDGNLYEELVTGKEYAYDAGEESFEIEIQAVGEDVVNGESYSSPLSDVKNFIYLPRLTQEELTYDDATATLSWPQLEHAKSYLVKLTDSSAPQTVTKTNIALAAGEHLSVSIMAVADEGDTYFSMYSEPKSMYILKAPQPQWSGATLELGTKETVVSWNQVTGATGYTVNVKKPNNLMDTYDDLTELARDFEYAFEEAGKYELTVQATTTLENTYNSALSEKYTITRLLAPTLPTQGAVTSNPNVLSDGFELKWTSVYGASGYQIYKDGIAHAQTTSGNQTSKRITDIVTASETQEQKIDYTIQTLGSVKDHTVFLPSIKTTEKLRHVEITVGAKPSNLTFGGWDASWTGVAQNTDGYSVKIDGTYAHANNETYSLKSIETAGDHQVSVCTRGDGSTLLPSHYTDAFPVIKLNAPTGLKIGTQQDEGKLSWEGDSRSFSYEITIKGTSHSFKTNTVSYAIAEYISKEGVNIGVTAIANDYAPGHTAYYLTSKESEVKEFKKLAAPKFEEVKVSNRKLQWSKPDNCGAFQPNYFVYRADDALYKETLTTNEKDLPASLFPAGTYSFKVQAIGDGEHYINSDLAESEPADFRILATPEVKKTSTGYSWKAINQAVTYALLIEDEAVDSKLFTYDEATNTYEYTPTQFTTQKDYKVEIFAVGDGGRLLVDSASLVFTQETKPLDAPSISIAYSAERYEQNGEVIVTVKSAVPFASGYVYEVGESSSTPKKDLEYKVTPSAPGVLSVSVIAVGGQFDDNGIYRLNSDKSSKTSANPSSITLLSKPSNDSIYKDTAGNLEWGFINGCQGYDLLITYKDNENKEHTVEITIYSQMDNTLDYDVLEAKGVAYPKRITKVQVGARGDGQLLISSEYAVKTWNL